MTKVRHCPTCKYRATFYKNSPCCDCYAFSAWECDEEVKESASAVDHPVHYNQGKYECIDVMVETFGKEAAKNFCLLNAFKYVWRTGEKNGKEDIKKAIWYLNKILELEGERNEQSNAVAEGA